MIRRAKTDDILDIVKLEKTGLRSTLGKQYLYQDIVHNPFSMYFVYELHLKVVGYIGYHVVDEQANILNFVIDINHQGQGYGRALLQSTIDELLTKHVKTISLEVRESNQKAIKLYESLGFKASHKRKKYYNNEDAWVYIKEV